MLNTSAEFVWSQMTRSLGCPGLSWHWEGKYSPKPTNLSPGAIYRTTKIGEVQLCLWNYFQGNAESFSSLTDLQKSLGWNWALLASSDSGNTGLETNIWGLPSGKVESVSDEQVW